jgi:hypothetical protein
MSKLFMVVLFSFIVMVYTAVTIPGLYGYRGDSSSVAPVYLITFFFSLIVFCMSSIIGIFRWLKGAFRCRNREDKTSSNKQS